ncbi:NAD(P)/FAD-dependent oxidoreductase, partial [Salmonella enterica subsp. enterica serovar Typhimurium]|uniref:NAD(P)/FAD-dependent oxidoreductase n=2 Tax=Pseudomonadati TaxID=3379134 RepID=UPI0020A5B33E
NWIPHYTEHMLRDEWQEIRERSGAQKISNKNPFALPNRLWSYLLQVSEIDPECRWSDLPAKQQNKLIKHLTAQEFI